MPSVHCSVLPLEQHNRLLSELLVLLLQFLELGVYALKSSIWVNILHRLQLPSQLPVLLLQWVRMELLGLLVGLALHALDLPLQVLVSCSLVGDHLTNLVLLLQPGSPRSVHLTMLEVAGWILGNIMLGGWHQLKIRRSHVFSLFIVTLVGAVILCWLVGLSTLLPWVFTFHFWCLSQKMIDQLPVDFSDLDEGIPVHLFLTRHGLDAFI